LTTDALLAYPTGLKTSLTLLSSPTDLSKDLEVPELLM